jgi:hypothetical protein
MLVRYGSHYEQPIVNIVNLWNDVIINTDLKWLMDSRTASSNSIGPGMRRVGCDIFLTSCGMEGLVWV